MSGRPLFKFTRFQVSADSLVEPWNDPVKIDEWNLALHGQPQAGVVAMMGICSSIAVLQKPIGAQHVLVGAILPFDDRNRRNAQRHLGQQTRFEDALRCDERNALTLKRETLCEERARKRPLGAKTTPCLFQEGERSQPHSGVIWARPSD
jgi:hypothetical protein